jgi:uncharacterized membrane protein YgcG
MSSSTPSLAARILEEVYALYVDPSRVSSALGPVGLVEMSRRAGGGPNAPPPLLPPRRRATVMIIGNHSAGKSTFVNHYVGEPVMSTGVAIETRGFTVVRSGVGKADVLGEAALEGNPHLREIADRLGADREGFVKHLRLAVRPSTAHHFGEVDLIDTPGLVDGGVEYPFDPHATILALSRLCDLILVFFDPIGQALCTRTMNVVGALNRSPADGGCPEKLRYFLSKADTVDSHEDLAKVLVQVATGLGHRLADRHGMNVPLLFIPKAGQGGQGGAGRGGKGGPSPSPSSSSSSSSGGGGGSGAVPAESNSLPRLHEDIAGVVDQKVQRNLTDAGRDCTSLLAQIDAVLADEARKAQKASRWSCYVLLLLPFFPLLAAFSFLDLLLLSPVGASLPLAARTAPWFVAGTEAVTPLVEAVVSACELLGLATLTQRLAAVAGAVVLLSAVVQLLKCRVRGLGRRGRADLGQLRAFEGKVEAIRKRVSDRQAELVASAQAPEFAPEGTKGEGEGEGEGDSGTEGEE